MKARLGAVALVACLAAPSLGAAQQNAATTFADNSTALVASEITRAPIGLSHSQQQEPEARPEEQMSTSGFFLGIIGMLAGAAIGSQIGQGACPDRSVDKDCMGRHAYTGALVAGTALVPIGVHIASKTRGNLLTSLAVSTAAGALFYFGFKAVPGSPIAMAPFLAAPVQVVTSVKIERRK